MSDTTGMTLDDVLFKIAEGADVIDLAGETITVPSGDHIKFQDCETTVINGTIVCEGDYGIIVSGTDAKVTFGNNLDVISDSSAIYVEKRGKLIVDGATITAKDWGVCVTGFTLAKDNSNITFKSGSIASAAIYIEKGGSANIESGKFASSSEYDIVADGNRTKVNVDVAGIKVNATNGAEVISAEIIDDSTVEDIIVEDVTTELDETEDVAAEAEESNKDVAVESDELGVTATTATSDYPRSAVLTTSTPVYGSPSTKSCIATIIGPITILDEINDFYRIRFKMPGVGRFYFGYIRTDSHMKF